MFRQTIKVVTLAILALAVAIGVGVGVGHLFRWYHGPQQIDRDSPTVSNGTKS
jgi:hypothetical protein